jgi:hypothetical protein
VRLLDRKPQGIGHDVWPGVVECGNVVFDELKQIKGTSVLADLTVGGQVRVPWSLRLRSYRDHGTIFRRSRVALCMEEMGVVGPRWNCRRCQRLIDFAIIRLSNRLRINSSLMNYLEILFNDRMVAAGQHSRWAVAARSISRN